MLKRYGKSRGKSVTLWFEDKPVQAVEGESVAAALLTSGVKYLSHSQVSAKPRTPYCWMGSCYECLLEIDGEQNQQSCLLPSGMECASSDIHRLQKKPDGKKN